MATVLPEFRRHEVSCLVEDRWPRENQWRLVSCAPADEHHRPGVDQLDASAQATLARLPVVNDPAITEALAFLHDLHD